MKVQVHTLDQESSGDLELSDAVFGLPPRADILARMVSYQLAKRRQGTHKVKGRSEVQGSTRKLFRQKGSGNARMGNSRTPIRRGGGVAHGPQVRSHDHQLTKKVRRLALKTALSTKAAEGRLVVLDQAKMEEAKTKVLREKFTALGWNSVLIIDGSELDEGFARAARNLPLVDVLPQQGANVHDILRRDTLVLTRDAVAALEARLS
ncbi:MAG: 50S ribosomal protein L4 [Pseudomonadota bacterium]